MLSQNSEYIMIMVVLIDNPSNLGIVNYDPTKDKCIFTWKSFSDPVWTKIALAFGSSILLKVFIVQYAPILEQLAFGNPVLL